MYLWTCEVLGSAHLAYSRSQNASVFSCIFQRWFELRDSSSYIPQCVSISGLDPQYLPRSLLFSMCYHYLQLSLSLSFLSHHRLALRYHLISWSQALILITSGSLASVYRQLHFLKISFRTWGLQIMISLTHFSVSWILIVSHLVCWRNHLDHL